MENGNNRRKKREIKTTISCEHHCIVGTKAFLSFLCPFAKNLQQGC